MKLPFTSPTGKVLFVLLLFLSSFWGITHSASAQNIPDANFAQAIRDACPTCIDGDDNLLPPAASLTSLDVSNKNIADLTGIEGFTALTNLNCGQNQLTILPILPDRLTYLYCSGNQLTSLPALPNSLITLYGAANQLTSLPTLPSNLEALDCAANQLTSLPTLPSSLTTLYCGYNQLTQLPSLPSSLITIQCLFNQITSLPTLPNTLAKLTIDADKIPCLPNLVAGLEVYNNVFNSSTNSFTLITTPPVCVVIHIPDDNFAAAIRAVCPTCIDGSDNLLGPAASLTTLDVSNKNIADLTGIYGFTALQELRCSQNQLTILPTLPSSLTYLDCAFNQLTSLPALPSSLTYLDCFVNQLTSLPTLPSGLTFLSCSANRLTTLPALPNSLTSLQCAGNQLTILPNLPSTLNDLYCPNNQLTALPTLPDGLPELICANNQLTSLPALPSNLNRLVCFNNQLASLPTLPSSLAQLDCRFNQFSSLPTLPNILTKLYIDEDKITCLPNAVAGLQVYNSANTLITTPPVCVVIHIPDDNFAAAIRAVCPTCIDGSDNLLPPAASLTDLDVSNKNIADLTGIYGFTALEELRCGQNQLTSLPTLPSSLISLWCQGNQLTSLPALPSGITFLYFPNNQLTSITTLPSSLTWLSCEYNQFTSLPTLPNTLTYFACSGNPLTNLPALPSSLTSLSCASNQLISLPALPSSLISLYCADNRLTSLPALPNSLNDLNCAANPLTSLPALPSSLTSLTCASNQLISLPALPSSLISLYCGYNQLTSLPILPTNLTTLQCLFNQITSLPTLPSTLAELVIDADEITCLPNAVPDLKVYNNVYNPSTNSFTLIPTPPVCASCEPPTGRQSLNSNSTATSAQVSWQAEAGKSYKIRWRAVNAPNWIEGVVSPNLNATIIYTIGGLTNATSHEWQIQSICNNVGGDFSPSLGFTTACQPGNLGTPLPSATFATLNWGDLGVPVTSNLRWRIVGATRWITANAIAGTTHQITGLTPGSNYEVQIQTVCMDGSTSDFSASTFFTTTACPTIPPVTSNSPVCAGEMVTLTASGGGTYLWTCPGGNCPDGFSTTSPTPSFIGSTTNDGTYSVTITTLDGCTAKLTVAVVVRPRPTASATSNTPVCVGSSLTLQASGGTAYTWTCPNGNCSFDPTVRNPSFTTTSTDQSGNYSVTVANTYGCTASASVAVTVNPLPTVTASSNSPVCIGGTIQLQASGGTAYAWKGPGGFSSTLANPTRVAAANLAGVYTVTITNATGCSVTTTVNVEVNPFTPNPVTSNSPVCEGETVTLTASGGSSYQWTCPGGNCPNGFSATSATPSFIGSASNDGTYSVTIITPAGCTAKSSIAIVVRPRPTATATANGPVCVGGLLRLQASGGTTYSWTCPNGNCDFDAGVRNPSFTPTTSNQSGTYSVNVANTYGCTASASVAVTVNSLPIVSVSSNSPVCVGKPIQLNASGGGTYLWKGPAGFSSASANPTRVAAANLAGTYGVTVTNTAGCTATGTVNVEVNALPTATITTGTGKLMVCGTTPLELSTTLHNGAAYQWKQGNTVIGTNANTLSVTAGGTYSVTVTSQQGCTSTAAISITAQPALTAAAAHSLTQGSTVLKLTANPAGLKYSWSGPTGFTSTVRNPSISPVSGNNAGTYTLTVTETATGCTASATTTVVLGGAARLATEEESTPEQSIEMVIAPNPTYGKMTVEIRLQIASSLELNWINLSGKAQQQWQSEQSATFHRLEVDVSAFPDGIYFLRAQTGNGQSISEKVIKRAN